MILETNDLTKEYGSLLAVDHVSWGVEAGEASAIIGPNGAGKSTFFNLITGINWPTSGEIYLNGTEITDLEPYERVRSGLAKTFQITNIFEDATVEENIAFAVQANESVFDVHSKAANSSEVNQRVEDILSIFDLEELKGDVAGSLSHGDQRKVEIGLAVATDPDLLLLDEPTAGMSTEETYQMIDLLETLMDESSITMIVTEHDIEFVLDIADYITVLHQGEILAEGSVDDITENKQVQEVYLGE